VNDPKVRPNNEVVTGSKPKLFIFLAFEMDTKNYRGTLVENGKKVENQPTLLQSQNHIIIKEIIINM
jgi:hypothetical protein